MSKAKMRHCFYCGEELGISTWDDPFDTCGKPECDRAARDAIEQDVLTEIWASKP